MLDFEIPTLTAPVMWWFDLLSFLNQISSWLFDHWYIIVTIGVGGLLAIGILKVLL